MRKTALAFAALAAVFVVGCGEKKRNPKNEPPAKYAAMPPRPVPDWLKGSLYEQVDISTMAPFRVSNYGLVALKRPTGDAQSAPNRVREYILNEMQRRSFGSKNVEGFERITPEIALRDPRFAIVRVDGFIPPGAYAGQRIDVQVSALEDTNTTSLATGSLYFTELAPNGANPSNPGSAIEKYVSARGYVFVNPAYALESNTKDPQLRRSLTSGIILNGGRVNQARPIGLRVRAAERRMARMIEYRIDELAADKDVAAAQDEGLVYMSVPEKYRGDWEHFTGVVLHTYFSTDSGFAVLKARQIVAEAVKPDAPLLDVSYALEALGQPALPEILPLLTHERPEVAYAAARAAGFIGDSSAETALANMARDPNNPFRVNAAVTLGALESSPSVVTELRELLSADDPQVRIEAYRALTRSEDPAVYAKAVGDKFFLDIVPANGPTLVFATRTGVPRIAVIGSPARLPSGTFFTALDDALSISQSTERPSLLSVYYRGVGAQEPVQQLTTGDLAELVARLGGEGAPGQKRFDFTYGEIVALLGKMTDAGVVTAPGNARASFVLQDAPGGWNRDVETAPIIPDEGPRPITNDPAAVGSRE
jgi:hypothetical protein